MSSDKKLEDLLALLQDEDIPQLDHAPDDLDLFVFDFKIVPSETEKVRASVIYAFYLAWKQAGFGTEDPPLANRTFFVKFSKRFKKHRWGDRRLYRINEEPFEITRWQLEEIKRETVKRKKKERERKRYLARKKLRRKSAT